MSRWKAAHMKPCIIFSLRQCPLPQRSALWGMGHWLQRRPVQALRNPKMRMMATMCPSHLCPQCWHAALSQTFPTPAPPSAGCLWMAILHTSPRVPRFRSGPQNRSHGESTLKGKQGAVSKVLLPPPPPPPPPHCSFPGRLRAS